MLGHHEFIIMTALLCLSGNTLDRLKFAVYSREQQTEQLSQSLQQTAQNFFHISRDLFSHSLCVCLFGRS